MILLRAYILSLFVGNALSLNHESFLGDGAVGDDPLDPQSFVEFFNQFAPLPPVPPPPTMRPTPAPVAPTRSPIKRPTQKPVITPTRPPIPAGRFPTPVVPPTRKPVRAPIPRGQRPTPNNKYPIPTQTKPKPQVVTRIADYDVEWGSDVNNCQLVPPNIFLNCQEGGVLIMRKSENAECIQLADDRVKCTQHEILADSSVEFTCSGIRKAHLMATATVGPNLAKDCEKDGIALKYLTLSRECSDGFDTDPTCNGGLPWKQGDTSYCASPATCNGQTTCSELKLDPLAMSNTNDELRCSRLDPDQDLQFHFFDESYISSISTIDWKISGEKRGCSWNATPLQIRCEDGGLLKFEENYPFCSINPVNNIGLCSSFAPYSVESEETISLAVRCIGQSESQLDLTLDVPPINNDVECIPHGTIIESVMLSRGCGEIGTDEFKLVNNPSFCDDENQVFITDDNRAYCFVGNTCLSDSGCKNIQIPHLSANNGVGPNGDCIYIV